MSADPLIAAFAALRDDPEDAGAWRVVHDAIAGLAARATHDDGLRRDAVRVVRESVEDKLLSGDLPELHAPLAYLRRAVKWRVLDGVRRRKREAAAALRAPPPSPPEPLPPPPLHRLEEVFAKASSMRDPWQRDHLALAWRQVRMFWEEDATLRDVVVRTEDIPPGDEEAVRLAIQRAHKAHARLRKALGDALDKLVAAGRLAPDDADELRQILTRLKRRQTPPPTSVPPGGENP